MTDARQIDLEAGLYLVATPIGSARDITLRALDILASADILVAEDTRTLRRLLDIHAIALRGRRIRAYHDHNGAKMRPGLVAAVAEGKSVAYASDAGTPMIADPGFRLAREIAEAGGRVTAAPGASAVIAALSLAGLPTDRFLFAGFIPTAKAARRKLLQEFGDLQATLVFYESPNRLQKTLADIAEVMGPDRQIAIARELTKKFEEILRGPVADLRLALEARPAKGEIVLLIDRAAPQSDGHDLEALLRQALVNQSLKDSVAEVVALTDLPRRVVYQKAVELKARDQE